MFGGTQAVKHRFSPLSHKTARIVKGTGVLTVYQQKSDFILGPSLQKMGYLVFAFKHTVYGYAADPEFLIYTFYHSPGVHKG